jgi:hypothetical protein
MYPPNLPNAVLWQVESDLAGTQMIEMSYFLQGMAWSADYTLWANESETAFRLRGTFTIANSSGEDYEDAAIRLVVGDIRTVEEQLVTLGEMIEGVATNGILRARKQLQSADAAADRYYAYGGIALNMVQEAQSLSEYYIYALASEVVLPNGWNKRLMAMETPSVPLKVVHRFENGSVRRFYTFTNDEKHTLGKEPLPEGNVQVFQVSENGKVAFVGRSRFGFVSVGQEVKLDLGPDAAVEVKSKQVDFKKTNLVFTEFGDLAGFDMEEEIHLEARNYRTEPVALEIPQPLTERSEILESNTSYEQKDAGTIQFTVALQPGELKTIVYRVRHKG